MKLLSFDLSPSSLIRALIRSSDDLLFDIDGAICNCVDGNRADADIDVLILGVVEFCAVAELAAELLLAASAIRFAVDDEDELFVDKDVSDDADDCCCCC